MCLIIDANVLALTFRDPPHDDFAPLKKKLVGSAARIVYGGQLRREYLGMQRYRGILLELDRRGSARTIPDCDVDAATKVVLKEKCCRSDDPHIIALARTANVRLLCSHDKDLIRDFSDSEILHPRGDVYQRHEHAHLISKHCAAVARVLARTRKP
jgi:hypothetical protein